MSYSQAQADRVRMTLRRWLWPDLVGRALADRRRSLRLDVLDEASGLVRDLRIDAAIFGGPWTKAPVSVGRPGTPRSLTRLRSGPGSPRPRRSR